MSTYKPFIAMMVFLVPVGALADAGPSATPISLPQILEIAQKENPDIVAARESWQVRRFEIGPAGTWPNPTFTFVDERFPPGNDGAPAEKILHYRVDQMVPFPGKLSADAQMRRHESLIAEAAFRSKEIEVLGDVRIRYFQLYLTDQKVALAQGSVAALKSVLQTAQSRLASSQSSTSDVFMAQIELRKMENMLFESQQARTLSEIELDTFLNRPTETTWGPAAPPAIIDLPASLAEMKTAARRNAPGFWAAAHEQNHARTMFRRSRLDYLPDFNFMYEREVTTAGPEGRQMGIGLSVPLWYARPRGTSQGAREHMREAESVSQGMQNMVLKMVHMEFTEATTHLTLARNYERDILPTAQSNLRVAREQYASGRGDFLRVLEAIRAWIEANNEYQEQVYHYGEHWSLLERWVGIDLMKVKEISDAH